MMTAARFPYIASDPTRPDSSLMPSVPLLLTHDQRTMTFMGLLDSGATVNVLPYHIGVALGLVWEQHPIPVQLTGNLAQAPARAVVLHGTITPFAPVRLAFAWTQLNEVPLLLGQVNFFLAFDVCFFRTQAIIELRPKQG
ncbi:MAG: retroviral-like aspartic protease [Chloroflexia bacterium]|nr:retroviral-like aspartic protease [Chloroflexia bacterium]